MNNLITHLLNNLALIDNSPIFGFSIVPYLVFLYFLYKNALFNLTIKIGFSLTILFVFVTVIFSILSSNMFEKTLIEVDMFHGIAEAFLTIADLVILYGFVNLLSSKEVKNS